VGGHVQFINFTHFVAEQNNPRKGFAMVQSLDRQWAVARILSNERLEPGDISTVHCMMMEQFALFFQLEPIPFPQELAHYVSVFLRLQTAVL